MEGTRSLPDRDGSDRLPRRRLCGVANTAGTKGLQADEVLCQAEAARSVAAGTPRRNAGPRVSAGSGHALLLGAARIREQELMYGR